MLSEPRILPHAEGRRGHRGVLIVLFAIVLLVPIGFSPWTVESGRVKLLALHLGVAGMLAVMAVAAAIRPFDGAQGKQGGLRFPRHGLHWAVGAWLLVNAASALASSYPYASFNDLWRLAMWAGLYAAVVFAVRSVRAVRVLAWTCVLATALVVGYGIAQRLGYDVVTYSQSPQDRLFSSLGNPNMLAGFLLLMIWPVAGLALDSRSWLVRAGLAILAAGMLWCLVYTFTKGAWIAFAISCLIAFAWFLAGWRFPYALGRRRRITLLIASSAQ